MLSQLQRSRHLFHLFCKSSQCSEGRLLISCSISQHYVTSLERITALQLLPMAATIVASGVGAEIADILPNAQHAMGTMIVSYVLWGMSTPMAMMILVIYYQRLAVHKLPSRETIVSCFLPLGPLGFGGFRLVQATIRR